MKKFILFFVLSTGIVGCSERNPFEPKKNPPGNEPPKVTTTYSGEELYTQKCTACHGSDGNLGVGGAKKISESTLSQVEREELIANGRKTMPAFNAQLSSDEIKKVAEYTFTLK